LTQIETKAFGRQYVVVEIRSTVLPVAFDVVQNPCKISIAACHSCPEFDCWQELRESGLKVDFRHILRMDSEFGILTDYLIDLSVFKQ
jgi:hypothetical protein